MTYPEALKYLDSFVNLEKTGEYNYKTSLKLERMKLEQQKLHEEIKAAQHIGDEERLERLTQEFHCLLKKRTD